LVTSNSHIRSGTKIFQLSTKIYYIEYKNILYYVPKYLSDQTLKYYRLHAKIFQIVLQNILDSLPKYFSKNLGTKKALSNNESQDARGRKVCCSQT